VAPPPPLLERLGAEYLRRLAAGQPPPVAEDAIHVLNPHEQAALQRIERRGVWRAALAGACSASVAASAEVLASLLLPSGSALWSHTLAYWAIVGSAAGLAATAEIVFIYRDALRSVFALSLAAGLDPVCAPAVMTALVRAALELPNPPHPTFGVDPCREVSRLRLVFASLAYKAKVGLTNFLVKALIRRILGRTVVRVWLAFVALPVSAAWNAIVAFRVIREARIRAMGPSFVGEAVATFLAAPAQANERAVALRAVASSVVRTADLHPNLTTFLAVLTARCEGTPPPDLDDTRAFLAELGRLEADGRLKVLRLLDVAAVVDGRLTGAERRLLREARRTCGLSEDLADVVRLRRAFVTGRPLTTGV
jgi:hypothetical protein